MKRMIGFVLVALLLQCVNAKIISCGGFVKSSIPVDLSSIQVKLLTMQGNLKYETDCNPSGYYMIPVYTKGKYQLKVYAPDGWIFSVDSYEIDITTNEDDSACTDDINFELFGFYISGRVLSGDGSGQSNVALSLYDLSGKSVGETSTKEDGSYEFSAQPGKYVISTSTEASTCMDRTKIPVEVIASKVTVQPDIRINGYSLRVLSRDVSGSPLPKTSVTLSSPSRLQTQWSGISPKPVEVGDGSGWTYGFSTDAQGSLEILCLPAGKYTLKPSWQTASLTMNFKQSSTPFIISSKNEEVALQADSFNVQGLSLIGVEIAVDGKKHTTSNEKGEFVLTAMKAGSYRFSAAKESYEFNELNVKFSPIGSSDIPLAFSVKGISVCGSVSFAERDSSSVELVVQQETGGDVLERVSVTPSKNSFCKTLPPGKYRISLEKTSLSFTPKSLAVDLTASPKLNVLFTQFKASISGRIDRVAFDPSQPATVQLLSDGSVLQEISAKADFRFNDVSPSKYIVRVTDSSGLAWWDEQELPVEVVSSDVDNVVFKQTGYRTEISSSHDVLLKYSLDSFEKKVQLNQGVNQLFFPKAGKYQLSVLDSCHEFFEPKVTSTQLVVPSTVPLELTAKRTFTSVSIVTDNPSDEEKFTLLLRESTSHDELTVAESSLIGKTNHSFVIHLDQSSRGNQFVLTPSSKTYLFSPASAVYTFEGECRSNVVVFKAGVGLSIRGVTKPAVAGARVVATGKADASDTLTGTTDSSGQYSLGPVWRVEDYAVEVDMEGYEFKRDPKNPLNFQSVRLSQLRITLINEKTKQKLPDVMVSLSGATSEYRSVNIVDQRGIINFIGLAPGEYFIRPILQEYKFDSTPSSIQVREGELQELTLSAKRFAYSAFGKVTLIGSRSKQRNLRVEAVSAMCENHQEEDTVDEKSLEYRVRGLRPECTYRMSLKDGDGKPLKPYPPFIDVLTKEQDRLGVDFVVLQMESESRTLMGKMVFEQAGVQPPNEPYKVSIFANRETVLHDVVVNGPSVSIFMFNLSSLGGEAQGKRNLSVGLKPSEAKRLKLEPVQVDFTADSTFKYVKIHTRAERKSVEVEVSKGNYFGLALILLLVTLFFTRKEKLHAMGDAITAHLQGIAVRIQAQQGQAGAMDEAMKRRKAKKS